MNDLAVQFMAIDIAKMLNLFQLALTDGNGQVFLLSFLRGNDSVDLQSYNGIFSKPAIHINAVLIVIADELSDC